MFCFLTLNGQEDPLEKEMASTPIFLPGKFHGQRSLEGYSSWGNKESDTTEQLTFSFLDCKARNDHVYIFQRKLLKIYSSLRTRCGRKLFLIQLILIFTKVWHIVLPTFTALLYNMM